MFLLQFLVCGFFYIVSIKKQQLSSRSHSYTISTTHTQQTSFRQWKYVAWKKISEFYRKAKKTYFLFKIRFEGLCTLWLVHLILRTWHAARYSNKFFLFESLFPLCANFSIHSILCLKKEKRLWFLYFPYKIQFSYR